MTHTLACADDTSHSFCHLHPAPDCVFLASSLPWGAHAVTPSPVSLPPDVQLRSALGGTIGEQGQEVRAEAFSPFLRKVLPRDGGCFSVSQRGPRWSLPSRLSWPVDCDCLMFSGQCHLHVGSSGSVLTSEQRPLINCLPMKPHEIVSRETLLNRCFSCCYPECMWITSDVQNGKSLIYLRSRGDSRMPLE